MSAATLKEKMKEFTEGKLGTVQVTGADLAAAGRTKADAEGGSGSGGASGPVTGTVEAVVPDEAKKDVFRDAAKTSTLHQGLAPTYLPEKVDITEDDRDAFLRALVTGDRYERPFSLFGGKLTGVLRCRKIAESDGIIAWVSHCVNAKKTDARMDYLTLLRNALLAAQVKSLRGLINEDFPEMAEPYGPTRVADGDKGDRIVDPGWAAMANSWGNRPEALVTALHNELQRFETRYWTMIVDAGNQNFWNPAASI